MSFQASKPLRFLFRHLFSMKTWSWSDLGQSWGGLWRSWGDLGWSWGGLWAVLGRLGRVLGGLGVVLGDLGAILGGLRGSWGGLGVPWEAPGAPLGDPKPIKKSIGKSIRNRAGSRRKKIALELRLSMFQSLTRRAANQIQPDSKSIDTAFEVISSYLSIYLSIY